MSRPGLNAASRPFRNARPVQRIVLTLWTLGALLLVVNSWLYWRAWTGQTHRQDEMLQIEARMEERQKREKQVESAIAVLNVPFLNRRVVYLNGKLAERTFGWSALFDHLSDVLPDNVRLNQLLPSFPSREEDDTAVAFTGDQIALQLTGAAKTDEAVLEFIDALFGSPSFRHPSLQTESKTDQGEIRWTLSAVYLPTARGAEPVPEESPVAAEAGQDPAVESREPQSSDATRAPEGDGVGPQTDAGESS